MGGGGGRRAVCAAEAAAGRRGALHGRVLRRGAGGQKAAAVAGGGRQSHVRPGAGGGLCDADVLRPAPAAEISEKTAKKNAAKIGSIRKTVSVPAVMSAGTVLV